MRSAVAGEFNSNIPFKPISALADLMASSTAKKTLDARNSGGSPTACKMEVQGVIA